MTWSYSQDPSTTDKDAVRFAIGDTDSADGLLSDEEITFLLSKYPGVDSAAYQACLSICSKFARLKDITTGKTQISYSQQFDHYRQLGEELKRKAGDSLSVYYASSEYGDEPLSLDRDFSCGGRS